MPALSRVLKAVQCSPMLADVSHKSFGLQSRRMCNCSGTGSPSHLASGKKEHGQEEMQLPIMQCEMLCHKVQPRVLARQLSFFIAKYLASAFHASIHGMFPAPRGLRLSLSLRALAA